MEIKSMAHTIMNKSISIASRGVYLYKDIIENFEHFE